MRAARCEMPCRTKPRSPRSPRITVSSSLDVLHAPTGKCLGSRLPQRCEKPFHTSRWGMRPRERRTSMFVDPSRSKKSVSGRAFSWSSPSFEGHKSGHGRLARLALDHLPHGLMILGEKGIVLDANGQAEALFGYSRGELVGVPVLPSCRSTRPAALTNGQLSSTP